MMRKLTLLVLGAAVLAAAVPGSASAATSCRAVFNLPELDGSRYEGSDVFLIGATGLSCAAARHIAHQATNKALGLQNPVSGIRHFRWGLWSVTDDLRRAVDRYTARNGAKRISWRFGTA